MTTTTIEGLILLNRGLEKYAFTHLKNFCAEIKLVAIGPGRLIVRVPALEDLCRLTYQTQLCNQIFLVVKRLDSSKQAFPKPLRELESEELAKVIQEHITAPTIQLMQEIIAPHATTRMCIKSSEEIDVSEFEREIGGMIKEILQEHEIPTTVFLKNPDITCYTFIDLPFFSKTHEHTTEDIAEISAGEEDTITLLTIDISGDIAKRDYRIFNSSMSLKGTTAFGVLQIAKYEPEDILFDPYCNSGTLIIEAALSSSGMSARWYRKEFPFHKFACFAKQDWDKFYARLDKIINTEKLPITGSDPLLRNITATCKNAKIAGVEKWIHVRRIDTDWLDIKLEESSVDKIITFIPGSSKHKTHTKEYKEFFYQAEYIIKSRGTIAVLCITREELCRIAEEFVDLTGEELIYSGQQALWVLLFKKRSKKKKAEKDSEE